MSEKSALLVRCPECRLRFEPRKTADVECVVCGAQIAAADRSSEAKDDPEQTPTKHWTSVSKE